MKSFSPAGTTFTVKGAGLKGTTAVLFGGTRAMTFTAGSAAKLTAMVPAGAATGPITVMTPLGAGTSSASFTVTP